MSKVPRAVADTASPEVWYAGNPNEIYDAYLDQYSKDMEDFLESRAVEMVEGGLVSLLMCGIPQFFNPETEYTLPCDLNLFASCLIHIAKKGRLSEEKLESFNLPYFRMKMRMKRRMKMRMRRRMKRRMKTMKINSINVM